MSAAPTQPPGTRPPGTSVYDIAEAPYSMYEQIPSGVRTATERWSHSAADGVNQPFFAASNVDSIQKQLRDVIAKRMGYVIDRQPDEQLQIIMRYVYMQHARNTGGVAEVRRLNELVLKEIVPQVASGLMQYLAYLRDASRLPTPIPRAQATSVKGTTTTQLFTGM